MERQRNRQCETACVLLNLVLRKVASFSNLTKCDTLLPFVLQIVNELDAQEFWSGFCSQEHDNFFWKSRFQPSMCAHQTESKRQTKRDTERGGETHTKAERQWMNVREVFKASTQNSTWRCHKNTQCMPKSDSVNKFLHWSITHGFYAQRKSCNFWAGCTLPSDVAKPETNTLTSEKLHSSIFAFLALKTVRHKCINCVLTNNGTSKCKQRTERVSAVKSTKILCLNACWVKVSIF